MNPRYILLISFLLTGNLLCAQQTLELSNSQLRLEWKNSEQGWRLVELSKLQGEKWIDLPHTSAEYGLLVSQTKPSSEPKEKFLTIDGDDFPGAIYKYIIPTWKMRTTPVALNTEGTEFRFFPDQGFLLPDGKVQFRQVSEWGEVVSTWSLQEDNSTDLFINQTFYPKKSGYFSMISPTLLTIPKQDLDWATVPGYFHGNHLESNLPLAYGYGNGVPDRPIVFSESTAGTLSPMVTSSKGFTLALIPDPGLGRDPWESNENTHRNWNIGLSHMNRSGHLSPSLYFPVLGQNSSFLEIGDQVGFSYRFSITFSDWFSMLNHAVYDVYEFDKGLELRNNQRSLSSRVEDMYDYLLDPETSLWRVEEFEGLKIGAQSYLGGVVGSDKDAMKNADYGAMWMLAKSTKSKKILDQVLPYALNFKLKQQQIQDGFFQGAAIGQYYLYKSRKFVEEWGDMVEPIALTYYILLDMGNILLFEPENEILQKRLRMGADLLLNWQKQDGSWAVAFDRDEQEIFGEVQDFRPTFYGLLVAYRILGDQKYLDGAIKGANWFLSEGVSEGKFLGVCGDARYVPDFATGQSAQAFLDLYDLIPEEQYLQAALDAAKFYTTQVYTHPMASSTEKTVNGKVLEDWQISQAGLSFEHGGTLGSANGNGPILLASHTGMFVRMYEKTGERIFLDMARSAAIGRDAFVNSETKVASYYWRSMDAGSGPFPHHAWWQIGWITDYLMAEASLRSGNRIQFPKGFITPKVGPHQTYGFAPGEIFGVSSNLRIFPRGIYVSNPSFEHILGESTNEKTLQIILMNQSASPQSGVLSLDLKEMGLSQIISAVEVSDSNGKVIGSFSNAEDWTFQSDGYGLLVFKITFK